MYIFEKKNMCAQIPVENIITTYFLLNEEKRDVLLSTLFIFKRQIEEEFKKREKCVLIEYTNSSIINAIQLNSELFSFKGNRIIYTPQDNKNLLKKENAYFFISRIPCEIKNDFDKIFSEINTQYENCSK
jgi:hypothetical protein